MKTIKNLIFTGITFCLLLLFQTIAYGQISAPTAIGSFPTDYSSTYISEGGGNDLVFVFSGTQEDDNIGALEVIASGCNVEWYEFDGVGYQPMGITGSSIIGLVSGGYMARVQCGVEINCYRAWVWVNQTYVNVFPIESGCETFNLHGEIDALDTVFVIQDPPGANFIVDENTEITVCFWADHTYVSDLGFYLKTPGHDLDEPAYPVVNDGTHEVVELLPSASDWGTYAHQNSWTGIPWSVLGCSEASDENTTCQSGDNVENFCFTTELEASNPAFTACVCDLETPLTGTFASAGPWDALYGSNAADEGWNVQIYDCEGFDVGTLNRTTLSLTGMTDCGEATFIYDSGDISGLADSDIADNSYSASTASSHILPPMDPIGQYTVTSAITNTVWSCSASSFSSTELNPLVEAGTSDFPSSIADFTLTVTETINEYSGLFCEHESTQEFIASSSDATITPISPLCFSDAPVAIEVADPNGVLTISSSAGSGAINNGILYPELAGPGIHTIIYTISGACPDTDTIEVEIHEHIVVENFSDVVCNEDESYYTVSFNVNNQDGIGTVFQVNDGNGFVEYDSSYSDSLPTQSSYSLTVTDMNGCDSYEFVGFRDCGCVTYAGTMASLDVVYLCQEDSTGGVPIVHNGNQVLDSNDTFEFILHDGSTYPSSTIISRSPDANFHFESGLNYETTYYISAICGNNLEGHVDSSDGCYSQTMGTPVMWMEIPLPYAGLDNDTCGLVMPLHGSAVPDGMIGYWSSTCDFMAIAGIDYHDPEMIAFSDAYGECTYTWNIVNGQCVGSDNVVINFNEIPSPFAGDNFNVCGNQTDLNCISSGFPGAWQPVPGISYGDFTDPETDVAYASYGEVPFIWTENNGACTATDTVIVTFWRHPSAEVSVIDDTIACGLVFEHLHAGIPENGVVGYWISTPSNGVNFYHQEYNDTVSVNSYGYYNFQWVESTGPINEGPNFCVDTSNAVPVHFIEIPSPFVGNDTIVYGNSIDLNVTNSLPETIFTWSGAGLTFDPVSGNETTASVESFSTYQITVTEYGESCFAQDSMSVTFVDDNGSSLESVAEVNIYPNPTNGQLTIEAESITNITLTNLQGQILLSKSLNANSVELDLSTYSNGIYLIKVETNEGVKVEKIVIE